MARNAVTAALSRGVRSGLLRRVTTPKNEHLDYPTAKEWNAMPRRSRIKKAA